MYLLNYKHKNNPTSSETTNTISNTKKTTIPIRDTIRSNPLSTIVYSITVVSLVAIFFIAGIQKLYTFESNVKDLSTRILFNKLPYGFSIFGIVIAILIELVAPLIFVWNMIGQKVITGNIFHRLYDSSQWIQGSLVSLIFFTIFATILYHSPFQPGQMMPFLKNLSIISGLTSTYFLVSYAL
jgi:uncharacterized membrane protein YphA (DoxX/SURF4 family)